MAGARGRNAASLRDELFAHPGRFELEQAVRLLARLWPERAAVGGDADPRDELVRFRSDLSAVFPGADLRAIEPARDSAPGRSGAPAAIEVAFLGVATPASFGSLPRRFAEEVRALVREKNTALRDFLDLFNHRLISLFVRARERHRPAALFERGAENPLERALAAVLGIGTRGLERRLELPDRALFARAGLLAMRPMPPLAIEALIESVFGVPARVEAFRPMRCTIEPEDRSRLGRANASLGENLFVGDQITLVESRFRVQIGPLGLRESEALLPDRPGFRQLTGLLRFATRGELEFDVQVLLHAREAPGVRLAAGDAASGPLGWLSWIGDAQGERPLGDAVFEAAPPASAAAYSASLGRDAA